MSDSIQLNRNGYAVTIEKRSQTATVKIAGGLPAGPSDWADWMESSLNLSLGHSDQIGKVDSVEGTIHIANRGGSRETVTIYDTKPRKL